MSQTVPQLKGNFSVQSAGAYCGKTSSRSFTASPDRKAQVRKAWGDEAAFNGPALGTRWVLALGGVWELGWHSFMMGAASLARSSQEDHQSLHEPPVGDMAPLPLPPAGAVQWPLCGHTAGTFRFYGN
ncbi:hypothetical protein PG985_010885 [Apiospora marii]|uniref:Uncharacterized protein n=1 Tax=Apiospora marii TaxID=335849 RepID=A0ABR1T286_9PEZI